MLSEKVIKRNPVATRQKLIKAAITLLARDGSEALSIAEVGKLAGVNRSTAYEYFNNREKLVEETLRFVSKEIEKIFLNKIAVEEIGERCGLHEKKVLDEIAMYLIENPNLCTVWLEQLTKRPDIKDDLLDVIQRLSMSFAQSRFGYSDTDTEIDAFRLLIMLVTWPLVIDARQMSPEERKRNAMRLSNEIFRIGIHGTIQPNKVQKLAEELKKNKAEFDKKTS